jgi:hypothetical protein
MVIGYSVELVVVTLVGPPFVGAFVVLGPGLRPEAGESVVLVGPLVGRPHVGLVVGQPLCKWRSDHDHGRCVSRGCSSCWSDQHVSTKTYLTCSDCLNVAAVTAPAPELVTVNARIPIVASTTTSSRMLLIRRSQLDRLMVV